MIKKERMVVINHSELARDIFEIEIQGDLVNEIAAPGQFVHIKAGEGFDPLLRRPISISSFNKETRSAVLIYRAEGKGTKILSTVKQGEAVDVLGPLGNGFPVDEQDKGKRALLVGGGIGVPPLYELSRTLKSNGFDVIHVLGFQTKEVSFYEKQFKKLGPTYVATVDGTLGTKGFVTDVIKNEELTFDLFYSCGPKPMLKALEKDLKDKKGYISLEERMGCGIGACFACVCHTTNDPTGTEYVKVCSDGPVFPTGAVVL
jgi:dihydroorotate dehydrogenase electron transfer subunit